MNRYRKGADAERKIVNQFRKKDCIAFRSAGSHSIVDVVVIDYINHEIKLIQSKKGKKPISKKQKDAIIDAGQILTGNFNVEFQLWESLTKRERD